MRTIIGIDPHKSSLTAVAVDDKGTVLGTRRLTVNKGTGTAADACRRDMAKDLIALIARIEEQMKKYQDRISDAGTTLMQIQGISTLLAAKIRGETAGVSRFPTAAHSAGYAGVSLLDASSGEN
jgi:transposase